MNYSNSIQLSPRTSHRRIIDAVGLRKPVCSEGIVIDIAEDNSPNKRGRTLSDGFALWSGMWKYSEVGKRTERRAAVQGRSG